MDSPSCLDSTATVWLHYHLPYFEWNEILKVPTPGIYRLPSGDKKWMVFCVLQFTTIFPWLVICCLSGLVIYFKLKV